MEIDLDVSVLMLDAQLKPLDLVSFRKLKSSDGSVQHCGDEREGDAKGDDEKVVVHLAAVHPAVAYVGFVVNSYSGQELDDVRAASCHLFDPAAGNRDVATFKMTGTRELDKHTALLVGMLYRDPASGGWALRVIAEPAHGRVAEDNVDELQRHIQRRPVAALNQRPAIDPANMQQMPPPQGPPPAPGAAANQIVVECPPGVAPGQQIKVPTPQGEVVVAVPAGVVPGARFAIALGGPPPAQGGTSQTC